MKLNKKGFGVAEIAIVILLIGILAAAVIVGFLGIKKNATDHVKEEATKSIEIINQTKHAYPTILSSDIKGLEIKAGEYEVYELGGKKIWCNGYYSIINRGTLFLSGNGTTDESSIIDGRANENTGYGSQYTAITNVQGAYLEVSDLIIHAGQQKTGAGYAAIDVFGGEVYLNNVVIESLNCPIQVRQGTVTIDGVNTVITNEYTLRTGGHLFYIVKLYEDESKVIVKNGTFIARAGNTWCWNPMSTLTITGGTFLPTVKSWEVKYGETQGNKSGDLKGGFCVSNGGTFNIDGGIFQLNNTEPMFIGANKVGSGHESNYGTITITGGEFKKSFNNKAPRAFLENVTMYDSSGKKISDIKIFDNPSDPNDVSRVIFHYAPNVGSDGGWGQYVAEGYEWYKFDGQELWGVRPVGTP